MSQFEKFPSEFRPQSYSNSAPLAVMARLLLAAAIIAVILAAFASHGYKPRLIGHYHLQRFVAWYLFSAVAAAALPRVSLVKIGFGVVLLAVFAETVRSMPLSFSLGLRDNIYSDIGGVYALLFPLALARWRDAVLPPGVFPPRRVEEPMQSP